MKYFLFISALLFFTLSGSAFAVDPDVIDTTEGGGELGTHYAYKLNHEGETELTKFFLAGRSSTGRVIIDLSEYVISADNVMNIGDNFDAEANSFIYHTSYEFGDELGFFISSFRSMQHRFDPKDRPSWAGWGDGQYIGTMNAVQTRFIVKRAVRGPDPLMLEAAYSIIERGPERTPVGCLKFQILADPKSAFCLGPAEVSMLEAALRGKYEEVNKEVFKSFDPELARLEKEFRDAKSSKEKSRIFKKIIETKKKTPEPAEGQEGSFDPELARLEQAFRTAKSAKEKSRIFKRLVNLRRMRGY